MANKAGADEVITQKHKRAFIQWGGPSPVNKVNYAGQDAQYLAITGVGAPESGGIDPLWVPDPRKVGAYRLVGRSVSPPDLASATLLMKEKHGAIPRQLQRIGCAFNLYEPTGVCKDLSDFLNGWSDYVLVYSYAEVTDKDLGDRMGWDSDDAIEDSLGLTLADIYPVGAIAFGEEAATQVDLQVVDIVYADNESCGSCGAENDGTKWVYALTGSSGGSPGLPAEVVYTVDGGATWSQMNITGLTVATTPDAIEVVGSRLVVLAGGTLYWTDINQDTGVPGSTWTAVTTGFVAAHDGNDIYVLSPREVFICGDGGYIYKSTDITAGVSVVNAGDTTTQNLSRIHGDKENAIVAVGAAGAMARSTNRGDTWAAPTVSPIVATLTAVCVQSEKKFWIGSNSGYVYYTVNGGETWVELTFSGYHTGLVRDIVFATEEVGFISHDIAGPVARILATWNGGKDWVLSSTTNPRLKNHPTYDVANRLAVPKSHSSIAVNNLAIGGLAGNGSDGIILLGIAGRI